VTGKTMAENLKRVKPYPKGQDVVRGFDNPIKRTATSVVLTGNLAAPTARSRKSAARKASPSRARRSFSENEQDALAAILEAA